MQGTIVMLMALSGLGCHHKSCDVAYVPSYYGTGACYGGCYVTEYSSVVEPSCYSGCYSSGYGCYGGCYSSGYGCYGGCYAAVAAATAAAMAAATTVATAVDATAAC